MATKAATPVETAETLPEGHYRGRVLKHGHGKIHSGKYQKYYAHNDEIVMPEHVARAHEKLGYAEYEGLKTDV